MKIKHKGFTLIELMISVAVIAILAAIAFPAYTSYTQRAARAAAQAELAAAAGAMERFKSQRFTYTNATAGTAATDTIPDRSPSDAATGQQKYNLAVTVAGGGTTYVITALSTNRFDNSGRTEALTIDQAGNRCYRPLATGVTTCNFTGSDTRW